MEWKYDFFFETHAALDEWLGDVIGFFWKEFCVFGIFSFDKRYARQFGIVVLNIGIGFWYDEEKWGRR